MHAFTGGEVTVHLLEGNELLVEGNADKRDGSNLSRRSFVRRFALPHLVDRAAITAALSSDGILTIISTMKGTSIGNSETARGSRFSSEVKSHTSDAGGSSWEEKRFQKDSSMKSEGCRSRASYLNQF